MNTSDIAAFIIVYESKSFNQAAKQLFVSPQGVVKIIQRLENELGVRLFERSSHGVLATPAADSFYHDAGPILAGLEKAKANLTQNNGPQVLRVKMTHGILSILSLNFLDSFREDHPEIDLFLDETSDEFILSALLEHRCDLGVMSGPINDGRLSTEPFLHIPQMVVLNRNHPLAKKKAIAFSDFDGQKLAILTHRSRTHGQLLSKLAAAHAHPSAIYEAAQLQYNHERASEDNCLGQTFQSDAYMFNFPDTVVLPYEDESFTWDTFFVSLAEKEASPETRAFIDYTKKWARIS